MQVVRLTKPEALDNPDVNALFERAYETNSIGQWSDAAREELQAAITSEALLVLVGVEEGQFKGCVICGMPVSAFFPTPIVYQYACFGSAELRHELGRKLVDILVDNGYTKCHGVNATGKADSVYGRWCKDHFKVERLGSVLELTVV